MRCLVCFDVKKEDAELKEGHKGVGVCGQESGDYTYVYDGNFFGTVEAQGSDSFWFMEDSKNDWDIDSGYIGLTSELTWYDDYDVEALFVSEPLDVNSNSPKNLGIRKGETYWKCYIGEHDKIDSASPFETDISLSKFTTDIPRRIDTSAIEDSASKLVIGLAAVIALLI